MIIVLKFPVAKSGSTYTNCSANGNSKIVYERKMKLHYI